LRRMSELPNKGMKQTAGLRLEPRR
jgi:hypothetical protein